VPTIRFISFCDKPTMPGARKSLFTVQQPNRVAGGFKAKAAALRATARQRIAKHLRIVTGSIRNYRLRISYTRRAADL
jgi:hypothetical protein